MASTGRERRSAVAAAEVGVAGVLLAPVWAAIGVLGALIAQCSIQVVRTDSPVEEFKEGVKSNVEEIKHDAQNF